MIHKRVLPEFMQLDTYAQQKEAILAVIRKSEEPISTGQITYQLAPAHYREFERTGNAAPFEYIKNHVRFLLWQLRKDGVVECGEKFFRNCYHIPK